MPETEAAIQIAQAIERLGAMGVLILGLWGFLTGKIVTASTMEKLLKEAEARTLLLAEQLKLGLRDAVRDALIEAREEWAKDTIDKLEEATRAIHALPCRVVTGGNNAIQESSTETVHAQVPSRDSGAVGGGDAIQRKASRTRPAGQIAD